MIWEDHVVNDDRTYTYFGSSKRSAIPAPINVNMLQAYAMDSLRAEAKRAGDDLSRTKRKLSELKKSEAIKWQATMRFMRILWLLGSGNSHLLQCAWILEYENRNSVYDASDINESRIWNLIGRDMEQIKLSVEEIAFLTEPITLAELQAWHRAWVFFTEWLLAWAVMQVNISQRAVASSENIHDKYERLLMCPHQLVPARVQEMSRPRLERRNKPEAMRQWLCRWRRRWGFKYRNLPNHSLMLEDVVTRKVGPKTCHKKSSKNAPNRSRIRVLFWLHSSFISIFVDCDL